MGAKLSVKPSAHPPFLCAVCANPIAGARTHTILSPVSSLERRPMSDREADACPIVCGDCMVAPAAHRKLFPECDASRYCDLYDHGYNLCADRAAAVAWLTEHGRIFDERTPASWP